MESPDPDPRSDRNDLWTQVKASLGDALDLEGSARAHYLEELRAGDPNVAEAVQSLLRSHLDSGTFMGGAGGPADVASLFEPEEGEAP